MALTVAQLQMEISASGADTVKKSLSGINDEAGKHATLFQKATAGLAGFFTAGAALDLVKSGFSAVTGVVGDFIEHANEAAKADAQTEAVIKSTGGAAGMTAQAVGDLANKLADMSGVDDQTVQAGENMLLTFTKIGGQAFPLATKAALDMSVAMGTDMKSSAIMIGKALNDPLKGMTALQRVGVTFSDQQKKQIAQAQKAGDTFAAQKVILDELGREFGGSAAAQGKTFAGAMSILNIQMDRAKETIGKVLINALSKLLNAAMPLIQAFSDALPGAMDVLQGVIGPIVDSLAGFVAGLVTAKPVTSGLTDVVKSLAGILSGSVVPAIVDLAKWVMSTLVPAFIQLGQNLLPAILPVIQTLAQVLFTQVLPAAKNVADAIIKQLLPPLEKLLGAILPILNPLLQVLGWILGNVIGPVLGLVINLIAFAITVIADIVVGITHFGDVLGWLGDRFGDLFGTIGNFIGNVLGALGDFVGNAIGWFQKMNVRAVLAIASMVGGLLGKIGELKDQALSRVRDLVASFISNMQQLPGRMLAIGQSIIDGLLNALKNGAGRIMDWLKGLASNMLSTIKGVFGIASPSKEMAKIGDALGAGLVAGLVGHDVHTKIGAHLSGLAANAADAIGGAHGHGAHLSGHAARHHAAGHHHAPRASHAGGATTDANGDYVIYLQLDNRTIGKALMPYLVAAARQAGVKLA